MKSHEDVMLRPLELDDPVLVDTVERVLERRKPRMSPRMLAAFRSEMLLLMAHDPEVIALARKLRRRRETAQSYEEALGPPGEEMPRGSGTEGQGGVR